MNLILKGKAGQGIQLMSFVLANILKDHSFNVSIISEYSPLMRAGNSVAKLVFSKEEIENPIFEDADIEYDLSEEKLIKELSNKNSNGKSLNMVLVGVILRKLNLKVNKEEIKEHLPSKFLEENLKAIEDGYGE